MKFGEFQLSPEKIVIVSLENFSLGDKSCLMAGQAFKLIINEWALRGLGSFSMQIIND